MLIDTVIQTSGITRCPQNVRTECLNSYIVYGAYLKFEGKSIIQIP